MKEGEPMAKYKVIGSTPAFGYPPGEEFTKDIDPDQESRMIARGAIKKVGAKKETTTKSASGRSKED
jgi:hypothetical protein